MKKFLIFLIGIAVLFFPVKVLAGGILDLRTIISSLTNIFSYNNLVANYTVTSSANGEWTQDAHDAQRTGYTNIEPAEPWTYQWFWPSPANANPPKEGRAITGGGNIYVPAGGSGLYALSMTNGTQVWNFPGTFNAAVAYDSGFVYAGSNDGRLYKINVADKSSVSFNAGNPLNKAVLLANGFAYVGTDGGAFYKINTSNMAQVWSYAAGSRIDTPAAFSPAKGLFVFATNDLYLHGVKDADGTRLWRVKPSPNSPGVPNSSGWNSFNWGWPVIAEQHGVVLIRQQMSHQAHYDGPPNINDATKTNDGSFINTMAGIRTWLQTSAGRTNQNLFALDLNTGTEKFIPAVGYGSVEWNVGGTSVGVMGTQPVIKTLPSGEEVGYMIFRSLKDVPIGVGGRYDYRSSGQIGEMVLDNTTVSPLVAGDLRFVNMPNSFSLIIDEETPITLAGNTIFNAHWGASEGIAMTNRSANLGITYGSPISATSRPVVSRSMSGCPANHTVSGGLNYFSGRTWTGAGFCVYAGQMDLPGFLPTDPNNTITYSAGFLPRYTFVSGQYIIVQGNGGDIFVLKHN